MQNEIPCINILVVSNDPLMLEAVNTALATRGYSMTHTGGCGQQLDDLLAELEPVLVIIDGRMSGMKGLSISLRCHLVSDAPTLLVSFWKVGVGKFRLFDRDYLDNFGKPLDIQEFASRVDDIILRDPLIRSESEV